MKTRRIVSGDQTLFVVSDVEPRYREGLQALVYQEHDEGYARAYPSDAPHLETAYHNFERFTEIMLRQEIGELAPNWEDALLRFINKITGQNIDWWLTGSAALSVRGLDVMPGDIDLITTADDALRLGNLLVDYIVQPVQDTTGWIGKWFCRAFMGACVEWVGGVSDAADAYGISDFGPSAAARLETVTWHGHVVRVPPLDLQLAVNERRGRSERAAKIKAAISVE